MKFTLVTKLDPKEYIELEIGDSVSLSNKEEAETPFMLIHYKGVNDIEITINPYKFDWWKDFEVTRKRWLFAFNVQRKLKKGIYAGHVIRRS